MKKILPFIFSLFLITTVFCILNSPREVAGDKKVNVEENLPNCPAPFVPQGSICVLQSDEELYETVMPTSNLHLNCQGHTLTPSVLGKVDDAKTSDNEFTPSQPDLAIFLNNTVDTKIQNCVIGTEDAKFEFGVYALNSDHNAIKHNTINVHTVGVHFLNSSHNKLSENEITYGSELGKGVHLNADSDFNIIEGNHVTSTGDDETSFDPLTGYVNIPGKIKAEPGTFFPLTGAGPIGGGVDVAIHSTALTYTLLNLSINGEVFQVPRVVVGNVMDHPDGNIIKDNVTNHKKLTLLQTRQIGIFIGNATRDSEITHNEVSGGKYGIFNAGEAQTSQNVPGQCSVTKNYCIAGVMDCAADEGTCDGPTSVSPVDARTFDNTTEENVLLGPYYVGVVVPNQPLGGSAIQVQNSSVNATVRGNTITGDLADPDHAIPVGIGLTGKALETSTVERNRVSGATVGLRLIQKQADNAIQTASFFGTEVTLNDFSGNGTNVKSTGIQPPQPPQPYTLATELSVDDQGNVCGPGSSNCRGNYWGHTCAESNGFIEFGNPGADSDDADVIDSHAYENPVAGTAEEDLPLTCF